MVLSSHENYFVNLLKILPDNIPDIYIFTTDEYKESVFPDIPKPSKYNWITQSRSESFSGFLSRASDILNNQVDLLISFPIYSTRKVFEFLKLDSNCTHLQMIFNVNLWVGKSFRVTPRIGSYLESFLRRQLITRFDGVIVEYSPIEDYLKGIITDIEVVSFVPVFFDNQSASDSNFRVTIPGHIEPVRRNYEFLIDTIEGHLQEYQNELEIHLLGSASNPEGESITDEFDRLARSGWDIKYYTDWIPIDQFENVLKTTDLIVSPIKKHKEMGAVTERYGQSKGSGVFSDAIRYGKPLALPDHYEVPPETNSIVRSYSDKEDLANIIGTALQSEGLAEPELEQLRQRFSLENQKVNFQSIISKFY